LGKKSEKASEPEGKESGRKEQAWEWIVAILGAALVAGAIGFMLYEAVAVETSPPSITLHVEAIQATPNGHLVLFRAVNGGGSTAEGLAVEGELVDGTRSIEVSEIVIDFVPQHSHRGGGLFFTNDPQKYELRLRAEGYEQP
jgi:uncharacterized protein (TIGR02588 family)